VKKILALIAAISLVGLTACGQANSAATLGDITISQTELQGVVDQILTERQKQDTSQMQLESGATLNRSQLRFLIITTIFDEIAKELKLTITKTELTMFHKSLNTAGRVKIGTEWIVAKQEMNVLGIVFDSRLEWARQVDKSILRARQSSQALRRIKDYFTITEKNSLVTSLVFSRMYYGSEIWLLPNLKERHFNRLFSQSGRSLKLINKDLSYSVLHETFSRATPKIFSLYQTCINYYDLIHGQFQLVIEQGNLQSVTLNNRRNTKLTFVRINQSCAGLNNIINRLPSVTKMMNKNWLHLSRDVFKSLCKQHIIQSQLLLL
jgi:hypothetical protein